MSLQIGYVLGALFVCAAGVLTAQAPLPSAIDIGQTHVRVYVVCPLIGEGTYADPVRPAISRETLRRHGATGATETDPLGFSWMPSDDGKLAIVEVVVRDGQGVAELRKNVAGLAGGGAVFERGKDSPALVDSELRKLRKDFDRRKLRVAVP